MFNYLKPRDAIYGRRTEVFKLYYKAAPGERIRYLDFCSLYPDVNWRGKYPVGHPTQILVGEMECGTLSNDELEQATGLIKCRILPPQSLKIPILPIRLSNKKLVFPLCRTCVEIQNIETSCEHTESERALIGTWVLNEVQTALKYGYKILNKIEIWIYNSEQHDPITKTGGLFTDYMKTFLKIKQESSGWPKGCETKCLFKRICRNGRY